MTQRRPRVGHIQFLNCLPLYWGLVRSAALLDMELIADTPDALSEAVLRGDLDIAAISVAEYLRHTDELLLLPDLAIGSDGPVLSVAMVSTVPVEQITSVALGSVSRTSVLLARMLLEERYGIRPQYTTEPPDLDAMLAHADAAVLIGDTALQAACDAPGRGLYVLDLGQAWREWSGLPMVFAVWVTRRAYHHEHPALVKESQDALVAAFRWAGAHLDEIADGAARWESFPPQLLGRYFRLLDYRLGEPQQQGLREFARRAAARDAVPASATLQFAPL